jgi:hypothetical protein
MGAGAGTFSKQPFHARGGESRDEDHPNVPMHPADMPGNGAGEVRPGRSPYVFQPYAVQFTAVICNPAFPENIPWTTQPFY